MNQRSIFFFSQIISLLKFSFASLSLTGELSLVLVNKQWADLFRQDLLWNAALLTTFPLAANRNRWPGQACPKGGSFAFFLSLHLIHQFFRRYTALYVCKHIGENLDDEIVGHVYLFLKEQLQMPPLSGVLHGTIIGPFPLFSCCFLYNYM